jgi:hypothetical protein
VRAWITIIVLAIRAFRIPGVIVIAAAVILLLLNIARILRIVPVAATNGVKAASISKGFLDTSWPEKLGLQFS